VQWGKYHDTLEMLEGLGGIRARKAGYDSIIDKDPRSPAFDEFVALEDSAVKSVSPKPKKPAPEKPPKPAKPKGDFDKAAKGFAKGFEKETGRKPQFAKKAPKEKAKELGFDDDRFDTEMNRIGSWGMSAPNKKFMSYKLLEPDRGKFQVERVIAGDREIIVGQRGGTFGTHGEAVTWARFDAKKHWNKATGEIDPGVLREYLTGPGKRQDVKEVAKHFGLTQVAMRKALKKEAWRKGRVKGEGFAFTWREGPKSAFEMSSARKPWQVDVTAKPKKKPPKVKPEMPAAKVAKKIEQRIKWDLIPSKKMTPAEATKTMLKVYDDAGAAIKKHIRPEHRKKIYQPAFGEEGGWRVDMSSPMYEEAEILVRGAPNKVTFDVAGAGRYEVNTVALPHFLKRIKPATRPNFFKSKIPGPPGKNVLAGPGPVRAADLESGEIVPLPKFQKAVTKAEDAFEELLGTRPELRLVKTVKDLSNEVFKDAPTEVRKELNELYLDLGDAQRDWLQASKGKMPSSEVLEEAKEASVNRIIERLKSEKGEAPIITEAAAGVVERAEAIKYGKWTGGPLTEPEMVKVGADIVTTGERTYKASAAHGFAIKEQWEKAARATRGGKAEQLLEDVGAAREGVSNLNIKGDTAAAARKRLGPVGNRILKQYDPAIERVRTQVNDYLKDVGDDEFLKYLDNYLPHIYVGNKAKFKRVKARLTKMSPHAKRRRIENLEIAAKKEGLTPLTQNVAKLFAMYNEMNWRVATTRHMLADLSDLATADGVPAIVKATVETTPDWKTVNHPAFEKLYSKLVRERGDTTTIELWKGGVKVHPELYPIVRNLLNEQWTGKLVRTLEEINMWSKQIMLGLSGFHHASLAESAQAVLAKWKAPLRGFVVTRRDPTVRRLMKEMPETVGEWPITMPFQIGKRLYGVPEARKLAISRGLQVGATTDIPITRIMRRLMSAEARTRNVPALKHVTSATRRFYEGWNKFLWGRIHTGFKMFSFYDISGRILKDLPDDVIVDANMTKVVQEEVAKRINDAFGGQEWVTKFWLTPHGKQILHLGQLAPDWTQSNINVAGRLIDPVVGIKGKGLPPAAEKAFRKEFRKVGRHYWRNMTVALVGGHSAIQFGIYTAYGDSSKGDKPLPWMNEKDRRWDIDITPLLRTLPWSRALYPELEKGERKYIHFGKQAREVLHLLADPFATAWRKSSPVAHEAAKQVFGIEAHGFDTGWGVISPESLWTYKFERAVSIGEKLWPFSLRKNNFGFAAPMRKGMTYWKARKAYESALELYADPSLIKHVLREGPVEAAVRYANTPEFTKRLDGLVGDITDAAKRNNVDTKKAFRDAVANARRKYYGEFLKAIEGGNFLWLKKGRVEAAALPVIRLNAGIKNILRSAKDRGIDLTREQKKVIRDVLKRKRAELYER
jgi:hypothetical protein